MRNFALATALMISAANSALASGSIAEVATVDRGYEVKLQLSDEKADAGTRCKFGSRAARILATQVGDTNSTRRVSLGCWVVNRDGSVEYSSMNPQTGQFDYAKVDASNFKKLAGFTEWGDYMGNFMLTGTDK